MATKINLLPWRAELREQRKKEFFAVLGGFVAVGLLIFGLWYMALQNLIEYQQQRNSKIQNEITLLEKKVKEIEELKKQRAEMIDRMKVIQALQGTRPLIVHVFDEIVRKQPDGMFFTRIERKDNRLFIDGTAESNHRVSSFMKNLDESEWFKNPLPTKLVGNPLLGEQGTDFNLAVDIELPQTQEEGGK